MKKIICLFSLLILVLNAVAQMGEIYGTVTDETNNPFPGVIVKVLQGGLIKGGTITEDDGTYSVKPLHPGTYTIQFSSNGYQTKEITAINISIGASVKINNKMTVNAKQLNETIKIHYKQPIVNKLSAVGPSKIERAPTRNIVDMASLGSNVKNTREISTNESYSKVRENDFMTVKSNPLSTMSIDVDHASYTTVRSFINSNTLPPTDAVRIEEMVNYFSYSYPAPKNDKPIALSTEITQCPWNEHNLFLKIGMQAKIIPTDQLPPANLVFLLDVSGSMGEENKLPLLKSAFKLLVDQLREQDHVSIVVYAGSSGLALPPTSGANKQRIKDALEKLNAGGSTAGGEGIMLAYKTAEENFIKGGNNRVVLATDGDFNVGVSSESDLENLIVKKRKSGVFLSCLGFGFGNYKDSKMEILADKGNGNYNYIDNLDEAKKTLVSEFGGTLFTVAKDVKTQIEFNPEHVIGYRLIGYENRLLNTEDFKDDKKDAGEMGAGHSVTILYELIPSKTFSKDLRDVDNLKYQKTRVKTDSNLDEELATIKFRYKEPDGQKSKELEHIIAANITDLNDASIDTRFSASVALFGMILSKSKYKESGTIKTVLNLAENAIGNDKEGYRKEFIDLVKITSHIQKDSKKEAEKD